MPQDKRPDIIRTVAEADEGVDRLISELSNLAAHPRRSMQEKYRQRIADEIRSLALTRINRSINGHIGELVQAVCEGGLTSREASEMLLKRIP